MDQPLAADIIHDSTASSPPTLDIITNKGHLFGYHFGEESGSPTAASTGDGDFLTDSQTTDGIDFNSEEGPRWEYWPRYGSDWHSFVLGFERTFDPVRSTQWMAAYWHHSFTVAAIYVALIFLGQRWMRDRPAFTSLDKPLVVWNLLLAAFSTMGAIRMVPELIWSIQSNSFTYSICTASYAQGVTGFWTEKFATSKIAELLDTGFIVFRKRPLTFLHWYHHLSVLIYVCALYKDHTASGRWFISMNYTVHAFMYTYYSLRALRFRVPRPAAMCVTLMQISQMLVGVWIGLYTWHLKSAGVACQHTWANLYASFFIYSTYFALFCRFFYQAYLVRKTGGVRSSVPLEAAATADGYSSSQQQQHRRLLQQQQQQQQLNIMKWFHNDSNYHSNDKNNNNAEGTTAGMCAGTDGNGLHRRPHRRSASKSPSPSAAATEAAAALSPSVHSDDFSRRLKPSTTTTTMMMNGGCASGGLASFFGGRGLISNYNSTSSSNRNRNNNQASNCITNNNKNDFVGIDWSRYDWSDSGRRPNPDDDWSSPAAAAVVYYPPTTTTTMAMMMGNDNNDDDDTGDCIIGSTSTTKNSTSNGTTIIGGGGGGGGGGACGGTASANQRRHRRRSGSRGRRFRSRSTSRRSGSRQRRGLLLNSSAAAAPAGSQKNSSSSSSSTTTTSITSNNNSHPGPTAASATTASSAGRNSAIIANGAGGGGGGAFISPKAAGVAAAMLLHDKLESGAALSELVATAAKSGLQFAGYSPTTVVANEAVDSDIGTNPLSTPSTASPGTAASSTSSPSTTTTKMTTPPLSGHYRERIQSRRAAIIASSAGTRRRNNVDGAVDRAKAERMLSTDASASVNSKRNNNDDDDYSGSIDDDEVQIIN